VWRYHVRRGNRTTAVCALAPKRNAIPYDHPMYTSFLIRSFVNMPSMFVLVSCLDHLERHQPLGLDRNHQIVKHVCESFCKVAIRQQRSPFFIVTQMLSVCTFLSGAGVLCFLGSSGAGSQANLFVQPCLANMAWSTYLLYRFIIVAFRTNRRRCRRFQATQYFNLHPCTPLSQRFHGEERLHISCTPCHIAYRSANTRELHLHVTLIAS